MNVLNVLRLQKLALFAAVAAGFVSSVAADAAKYSEFTKHDQPFAFFKVADGDKYPYMIKAEPGFNRFSMILLGSERENGDVVLAKTAQDLETMTPIRNTLKCADSGVQIDKIYEGFREAYVDIALEATFKLMNMYPMEGYKGKLFVDEYLAGMPMKWTLSTSAQLSATVKFLQARFIENKIAPAANKPLLLVELYDKSSIVGAEAAFLNNYYTVLDLQDPEVATFFVNAQKFLNDALDKTKDAKNVAEAFGEGLLRELDEKAKKFEAKKLIGWVTMIVLAGLTWKAFENFVFKPISNKLFPEPATAKK